MECYHLHGSTPQEFHYISLMIPSTPERIRLIPLNVIDFLNSYGYIPMNIIDSWNRHGIQLNHIVLILSTLDGIPFNSMKTPWMNPFEVATHLNLYWFPFNPSIPFSVINSFHSIPFDLKIEFEFSGIA